MSSSSSSDLKVNILQSNNAWVKKVLRTDTLVVASGMQAPVASISGLEASEITLTNNSTSAATEVAEGTLKYHDGILYMSSDDKWVAMGPFRAGEGIVMTREDRGIVIATQNTLVGNDIMSSRDFVVLDPNSAKAWRIRTDGDNLIFEFGSAEAGGGFVWQRSAFQISPSTPLT